MNIELIHHDDIIHTYSGECYPREGEAVLLEDQLYIAGVATHAPLLGNKILVPLKTLKELNDEKRINQQR